MKTMTRLAPTPALSYPDFVARFGPYTMAKELPGMTRVAMNRELEKQKKQLPRGKSIGLFRAEAHRDWANNRFTHPRHAAATKET